MGKIVELLDPKTGLMKCRGCGMKFSPNIQPDSGGKFYPGSCKCPNECTAQDVKSNEAIKSVTAEMKKKSITCPGIKYSVLVSGFTPAIKKVLREFYPEELSLINEQVQKFKRQGIVNFNEDLRPLSMIVDLKKVLKEKEEENVKMLVRKSIIKGFRG